MTIEQYQQLPDTGARTELVDGVVIELASGTFGHAVVRDSICAVLNECGPRQAGAEVEFRTVAGRVRRADVAWFSRPPALDLHILPVPSLVVEVVSPSDSAAEMRAKVHEYLDAGVITVWVVYLDAREADIWNRGGECHMGVRILTADCLPGFELAIETILPAMA